MTARMGESRTAGQEFTFLISLACLLLIAHSACGYRIASKNRTLPEISTLSVVPLRNETTTFEVEQILTQSLVRAFVERSDFRIVNDPVGADAVLRGTVSRVIATPTTFGRTRAFGTTFQVTLRARIEVKDRRSGKVLFKNDDYIFREQYIINVDVKNFFSELNPALERVAQDFASSVVTTILEGF